MQQCTRFLRSADSKWITVLWYPVWGPYDPAEAHAGREADSSTMGHRDQLLDAAGEILAARPDAAKKDEGKRITRRSPIDEGAEPRATRLDDAPPSLLEALRTLSLAITGWYQLPDDAVPSIAGSGGERAEDDIAYLEQAQTEAANHMKAAAWALEAATEYAASLRSRASSGPEHR
jgi:hypothetical protein